MSILDLQKNIVASLFIIPCTLDELCGRDFLKNYNEMGVDRILMSMEKKKMIFLKGNKYYAYKKYALSREMSEYDLIDKSKLYKRPTAEEVILEWNKKSN